MEYDILSEVRHAIDQLVHHENGVDDKLYAIEVALRTLLIIEQLRLEALEPTNKEDER